MMRKILILSILLFSQFSRADFSFQLENDAVNSQSFQLGSAGLSLCQSRSLKYADFSESGTNAVCNNYITGTEKGIDLIIPIRVTYTSTPGSQNLGVYYRKEGIHPFQIFDIKNVRDGAMGGGVSLFNGQPVALHNGDVFLYELEIRALILGASAPYDNKIIIDLVAE